MKIAEQYESVTHRIRSMVHPQHVWINTKGMLCCGDDYPEGTDYQAVGTYTGVGFDEKQFQEDIRYAETVV